MKAWLLALSLLANAILCHCLFRSGGGGRNSAAVVRDHSGRPSVAGEAEAISSIMPAALSSTKDTPAALYKALRQAGVSRPVRVALLRALLEEKYQQRKVAAAFPDGISPVFARRGDNSPRTREKMDEINRDLMAELEAIAGDDVAWSELDADPLLAEKWRMVPPAAVAQLSKLDRDYAAALAKQRYTRSSEPGAMRTEAVIDQEYENDVRALLSGRAADEFIAFNSPYARVLQSDLADAEIRLSEEQYLKLYEAEKQARAAILATADSATEKQPNTDYLLREIGALGDIAGPTAALQLAERRYADFRDYNQTLAQSGVGPAERMQGFTDYVEGFKSLGRATDAAAQSRQAATLYAQLTGRLSPSARADFDNSRTGKMLLRLKAAMP